MQFKGETFEAVLKDNSFIFSGEMELLNYKEVSEFLTKSETYIKNDKINIDLRNLTFLNSSGIRALAVYIFETQKDVNILINESITWQKVGITPIIQMKKMGQKKVSG